MPLPSREASLFALRPNGAGSRDRSTATCTWRFGAGILIIDMLKVCG